MFKAGTDCGEPTKKSVKRATFSSKVYFRFYTKLAVILRRIKKIKAEMKS